MVDGSSRLDDALSNIRSDGVTGTFEGILVGTVMTLAYVAWDAIESLGSTFLKPIRVFVDSLASLIQGSVGGPVLLLEAAVDTGVQSVTEGVFAELGLFAYPITMIAVMAGIYIFATAWAKIDLSPWNFLRNLR